ncbi:hypothetical protein DRF62_16815 [Chryseobacterium piscium]|uniref:DUF6705 domain-containing protein n=1 Tax=Chryseobacterium piscium TaxID=333702 RepID=A0A3D9BDQ1_9FLAO|nr:DUF6705 family protein [Chryseobacterium piscium]REC51653.1 hypothetical protein DRF62_16815 [Chryseobacterium piscium]
MKNILKIIMVLISIFAFSQNHGNWVPIDSCPTYTIVPLRTYTDIPENQCYYMKDINNELQDYVGTWKGTWDNKTLFITFKKIANRYNQHFKYNEDLLIAKFKVTDSNGTILFDNTSDSDNIAKIIGSGFAIIGAKAGPDKDIGGKYTMLYHDESLCNLRGSIYVNFANTAKTQIQFEFNQRKRYIFPECYFYNYPESQYPRPLPNADSLILTKQ